MSQSCLTTPVGSNSRVSPCNCLSHWFGSAADRTDRTSCYGSDMSESEWQAIRPLLPVPAWLQGQGGRPEGYCRRVMLDAGLLRRRQHALTYCRSDR